MKTEGGDFLRSGDFTPLASNYALYRPGYSPFVLEAFLALLGKDPGALHIADVGAGTGIWSRALAGCGVRVTAVEPNEAMREAGIRQTGPLPITWRQGAAEETGLPASQFDAVCMASSFHWTHFEVAIKEFCRILKPKGLFLALWNTRHYESNPLLVDIEESLHAMVPHLKRVSSGRSEFCAGLQERLRQQAAFADVLYLEGRHIERQSREHYMGLWESVNDVRAQAGEEAFARFIRTVRDKIAASPYIEAEYATRAWLARREA